MFGTLARGIGFGTAIAGSFYAGRQSAQDITDDEKKIFPQAVHAIRVEVHKLLATNLYEFHQEHRFDGNKDLSDEAVAKQSQSEAMVDETQLRNLKNFAIVNRNEIPERFSKT